MNNRQSLHQKILSHQNSEAIKEIKETKELDKLNAPCPRGLTPIQIAAREGISNVVIELLTAGVDIYSSNSKFKIPRQLADEHGHKHVESIIWSWSFAKDAHPSAVNIGTHLLKWQTYQPNEKTDLTSQIIESELLLQNQKNSQSIDLMTFWMTTIKLDPYQALLDNPQLLQNRQHFNQFIARFWTRQGLLQFLISRLLSLNEPRDRSIFLFVEKKDVDIFNALITCLQHRYDDPVFSQLLADPTNIQLKRRLAAVKIPVELQMVLNNAFMQFSLPLECNTNLPTCTLRDLPAEIWMKTINEMFYGKVVDLKKAQENNEDEIAEEKKSVAPITSEIIQPYMLVSRHFHLYSKMENPSTQKQIQRKFNLHDLEVRQCDIELEKLNIKIAGIENDIAKIDVKRAQINELFTIMAEELNNVTCSQRPWAWKLMAFNVCLTIIEALNIYCVINRFAEADRLEDIVHHTSAGPKWNNTDCATLSKANCGVNHANTVCNHHFLWWHRKEAPDCMQVCDNYDTADSNRILATVTASLFGLINGISIFFLIQNAFNPIQTKDHREIQPLTSFSPLLQFAAADIINREDKKLDPKATFKSTQAQANELLAELKTLEQIKMEAKTNLQSERGELVRQRKHKVEIRGMYARYLPKQATALAEVKGILFERKTEFPAPVRSLGFEMESKCSRRELALDIQPQPNSDLAQPLLRERKEPKHSSRCVVM